MGRTRSPNYPALGLKDAVELVLALWRQEKRTSVPPMVAARAWGYRSLSGPARVGLAALKRYGLVEEDAQGVRVSELGVRLAVEPADSEEVASALREAALAPELFRELHDSHRDASEHALRSHLVADRGFSDPGARRAVRAFRETIAAAGLAARDPGRRGAAPVGADPRGPLQQGAASRGAPGTSATRVFTWPLSNGVTAELRLSGEAIGPGHFEELRRYLGVAYGILGRGRRS